MDSLVNLDDTLDLELDGVLLIMLSLCPMLLPWEDFSCEVGMSTVDSSPSKSSKFE